MQASILPRSSGTTLLVPTEHHAIPFGVALNRIRKVPVVNGVIASLPQNQGAHGMSADDRRIWMTLPNVNPPILIYFDTLTGQLSQGLAPNTTWDPTFPVAHPNGHVYVSDLSNPVLWDFNPATNTWNSIPLPQAWNRIVVDGLGRISSTASQSVTPSGQLITWPVPTTASLSGDVPYYVNNGQVGNLGLQAPLSDTICVDSLGRVIGINLYFNFIVNAVVFDPALNYQPVDAYLSYITTQTGGGLFIFACDSGDAVWSGLGSNFITGVVKSKSPPYLVQVSPTVVYNVNTTTKVTPAISSTAAPWELCLGPDGCIWAADSGSGIYQVDRMTLSVTTYPTSGGSINITQGPDGCLYTTSGGLFQISFADRWSAIQDFVSNPVTISTATYTIGDGFHFVCNGTVNQTITLPQSPNRWIHIFKTSAATLTVTINPPAGGTINGSSTGSIAITAVNSGVLLFSDSTGLNWNYDATIV
jgi:hypothetical protein